MTLTEQRIWWRPYDPHDPIAGAVCRLALKNDRQSHAKLEVYGKADGRWIWSVRAEMGRSFLDARGESDTEDIARGMALSMVVALTMGAEQVVEHAKH